MQFKPIWQALPSWSYSQKFLRATGFKEEEVKRAKSPFTSFLFELCAFGTLLNISNAEAFSWSQGSLWMPCVRYPLDKMNKFFSGWGLDWFESRLGKYFPSIYDFRDSGMLFIPGRLSCAFPGAGKRRMFAIEVHPGKKFDRYAVLDDYILIADQHVGPVYKSFIDDIGVKISTPKSTVSNTGCVEKEEKETPTDSGNTIKIERENRLGLEDCPTTSVIIEGEALS
ncbi:hypothetical protein M9H77_00310 [Catharanthus roseus]|nr:hypothetical protein M9H77_00310 [Catharanthus roseus]